MKTAQSKSARAAGQLSLVALAVLAVLASSSALADDTGWYAGANLGQSRAKIDDAGITSDLLGRGFSSVSIVDDDRSAGYKIFGGYQLNKNFAIEGGYFSLGNFGYTATTIPAGTLNGNIKLRGLNLDLVGILPITEKFSAFGRIGANHTQARDTFRGTGAVQVLNPNPSKRDTNLKLGLGVQYALTESLALRAEVERYRINDAIGNKGDIDLVSVGLLYRFGAKAPAPVARVAAPLPVAVVVAPQPVIVAPPAPAPPPPAPRAPLKVTFAADSLFDFDQSRVRPAGTQQLDKFAADLRGVAYDVITVTGHTDRLGSHAYNMKLSTRRAEAVSAYLVTSAGIPASKIVTQGVNGAEPVTAPGDCAGKKATPKLIACLQPDRRVEIEVTGTRD